MLVRMAVCRLLATTRSAGALQRSYSFAHPGISAHARQASSSKTGASLNSRPAPQSASSGHSAFRNEKRPTEFDKKVLLWTGRFRKEEDIPPLLSVEVLKAAQSQLRIRICYIMIALTLLGCMAMVFSGKLAAKRDDTLLKMNAEKKAKWRAEGQQERGMGVAKAE